MGLLQHSYLLWLCFYARVGNTYDRHLRRIEIPWLTRHYARVGNTYDSRLRRIEIPWLTRHYALVGNTYDSACVG
jgi:hypothetical protein